MNKNKFFYLAFFVIWLSACTMQPTVRPIQVEVSKGVFVNLPKPEELGKALNVSQLITAQWGEGKQQKLLVQLQVDKQRVALAGFSAWGAKLLSLTYSDDEINTSVISGLADTLPQPEQVLFNVMLSIWPVKAWQKPLADINWSLFEQGLQRQLIDNHGRVVIEISYQTLPYIDGTIVFKDNILDYTITIETNKVDN